ncbi:Putative protein phosphatase 2C 46 [Apostasia shenzhenica]|uniref:protein-serine/threonine phosphatase n=1 Tax=Apostasia shenzhenica TaxID=1088818 RepID=A0A2I0AW16_9ASPA|nr:Putative protein phosphatase 2C 46 [Apostasia shenzhenica]
MDLPRRLSRALGVISSANSGDTTTTATTSGRISVEYVAGESSFHWAQGIAGEDRVHIVVSDERRWLFVGIYNCFNVPDATDYLLSNLYLAAQQWELKGAAENPELALMGSCVPVMLMMKGKDVYLMNVGDITA